MIGSVALAINGGKPIYPHSLKRGKVFGEEERQAVWDVMETGVLSKAGKGKMVQRFEEAFASYHKIPYAITTTSGTTALHTALSALEVGPIDEVIIPDLTFVSCASTVLQTGAKVVFCDIDADTLTLSASDLEKKITGKTKAIMVVHLYGRPAAMDQIISIARSHNLYIIEDCAQAHGAFTQQGLVGTLGDIGCFSFYQTKNMSCGEGGMVITANETLARRCRSLVRHGLIGEDLSRYDYDRLGYNYAMTELQAAVGLIQLNKLAGLNKKRGENASRYRQNLHDLPITFQADSTGNVNHCLTGFVPEELCKSRDWFLQAITAEGAWINCLYPLALSHTVLFTDSRDKPVQASVKASRLFNLYTNPDITSHFIDVSCDAIRKVLRDVLGGRS